MPEDTRDLSGPRASSLAMCERKVVYEALGVEGEEVGEGLARIYARGRRLGQMVADEMAEQLDEQGRSFEVEREIKWGHNGTIIGTGHADLFIPDDRHTVEVVSTQDAALPRHKCRQVAIYSFFDDESDYASVLSLDPATNEEKVYPVEVEGFAPWITRAVARVAAAIAARKPEQAFRALRPDDSQVDSPAEFPCFNCPFRRMCWAEYQPLPPGELPEELHAAALRLADIEDTIAKAKKTGLEDEREQLREKLMSRMKPGVLYRAPGLDKIRFTEVAGRRTFSLSDYLAAGHTLPATAEPFIKQGKGSNRWTLNRSNR